MPLKKIILDKKNKHLLSDYSIWIDRYGYVECDKMKNYKKTRIKLHHLIIGKPENGMEVDHKNGNKLDNRKINLHFVNRSYNIANRKKRKDSKQPHKGIQLLNYGKWRARTSNGKQIGIFKTAELAYSAFKKYSNNKFGKIYVTT